MPRLFVFAAFIWLRLCAFGRWLNDLEHCPTVLVRREQLRKQVDMERHRV